jgi:hypothetical protein
LSSKKKEKEKERRRRKRERERERESWSLKICGYNWSSWAGSPTENISIFAYKKCYTQYIYIYIYICPWELWLGWDWLDLVVPCRTMKIQNNLSQIVWQKNKNSPPKFFWALTFLPKSLDKGAILVFRFYVLCFFYLKGIFVIFRF